MSPELPPPAPPAERSVGQLVAETIRTYGEHFWLALPLGLPFAVIAQVTAGLSVDAQVAVLAVAAPLMSASYVGACVLVASRTPRRSTLVLAWAIGMLVWFPAPLLLRVYVLPSLVWLAFFGLSVPAAVNEGTGLRSSLRRGRQLATADFVHALGSLCTLVLLFALSAGVLGVVLHGQADAAVRIAAFLADLVLSPLLYLGGAILYLDQAARVGSPRPSRRSQRRSRRDADLHPPLDADASGRSDAQVEP